MHEQPGYCAKKKFTCCAAEVNSVVSSETELPYNYYSLPFCKPVEGVRKSLNSVNPGTILMGSRIENSPYNFSMLVCTTLASSPRSRGI